MKFQQKTLPLYWINIILLVFLFAWPETIAAAPVSQEGPIYIVQQSDTLNSIALRFGISPEDVAAANNISDPNALNIGQRLIIPGLEGINGVLISQVLPFGSSLIGLTRQFNLQQNDLVFLNRLASPSETIAGIKFIIPINEEEGPLTPLMSAETETTLIEIAIQSGASPWQLIEENQLKGNWDILPGETFYSESSKVQDQNPPFSDLLAEITLNDLPVIQGETLHIAIASSELASLHAEFDGNPLQFFSEDGETHYTFHGIHALAEPGPVPLEITANLEDGSTLFSFEQLIMVADGEYGNEWLSVDEDYTDEAVIAEENAYLQPIIDQISSQKRWDGRFQYPVDEPCVNSNFGQRRNYNDGGLLFYHTGMDFGVCAPNLNIYSVADGEVVLAEELVIKGKYVLIDHGWGVFSAYAHLEEFNVETGDIIEAGDLIGLIGNTGRSLGPHLHFEVIIAGKPVNPQTWLDQEFPQQPGD